MSTYQRERLAAETEEERDVRLQCDRDTGINSLCSHSSHCLNSIPKKHKFHAHLATLDVSTCTTCLESFPG